MLVLTRPTPLDHQVFETQSWGCPDHVLELAKSETRGQDEY
jgi:hypothetical protein